MDYEKKFKLKKCTDMYRRPNGDEVLKMVNKRYEMIMEESI